MRKENYVQAEDTDKMLQWKNESGGNTALLVEGARRIGKSTVVEEFAKNEYEAIYLLILLQRRKVRAF